MAGDNGRSFSGSLGREELRQHILRSYFIMRVGIAIIGLAFPLVLLIGGLIAHVCAQPSMSAYYYAVGTTGLSMRNWFVGLLFAVSISLGLYRGFSLTEDRLLDAAAILGIGIAIFPTDWNPSQMTGCGVAGSVPHVGVRIFGLPVHGICAIGFFLAIALVCWFCADDTLSLVHSPARRRILKRTYRTIALLMPTAMFAAWGLNTLWGTTKAVFWSEAVGIFAFGTYWLLKGFELNRTAADLKAAMGRLRQHQGRVEEVGTDSVPDPGTRKE